MYEVDENITVQAIGQRLISDQPQIMYERFPGSGNIVMLPPGRTTNRVTSYLPSGYYQLEGSGTVEYYYIPVSNQLKVVEQSKDDSSLFDRINSALFGFRWNYDKDVNSTIDHLSTGVKEGLAKSKFQIFDFTIEIRKFLIIAGIVLALWILNKLL